MNNAAARVLSRQRLARSGVDRISHNVGRGSITTTTRAGAPYSTQPTSQPLQRPSLSSTTPRPFSEASYGARAFHVSSVARKKNKKEETQAGGKRGKSAESSNSSSSSSSSSSNNNNNGAAEAEDGPKHPQPTPEEPLDFADVDSRLSRHAEHFRAAFRTMHAGGRFDPDVVGSLRVTVDRRTGEGYALRELAQVVPRGGRAVSLLAHEAAYVKPILSAVQASPDFNQQPQRDPDNELELVLRIEPETPADLARRARALAHEWRERVRAVRQRRDKLHAAWRKDGRLGPDLKRTADKELEKVIKTALAEVDAAEKSAVKAAESS